MDRVRFPKLLENGLRITTMELENSQNNALAKLPMLKLEEYEMWEIRIKQYFQIQDYALWEVIENGNSWVFKTIAQEIICQSVIPSSGCLMQAI
ncbi:hypothetical protein Tco_1513486 [Tanacetum coccineum]